MISEPFSGWSGPRNPRILIVGEAWGENEAQVRQPFVGTSGLELWRMLGEAMPSLNPSLHSRCIAEAYRLGNAWVRNRLEWLTAAGIAYTNVLNLRPPGNKLDDLCAPRKQLQQLNGHIYPSLPAISRGLYLKPEYLPHIERLYREIELSSPNLVIAAGNTACWALLHSTSIGSIRGTVSYSLSKPVVKVIPIYHPAAILRQWNWRAITVADLIKAAREAESPNIVRPLRSITIDPDIHTVLQWRDQMLASSPPPPPMLAVDIETHWQQISCIGFAWSRSAAIVIPFLDLTKPQAHYWSTEEKERTAWYAVRDVLCSPIPKLFQNGMYDIQYILRMGIKPVNMLHDTMLLHHSLFPEMRKGLGFLGSVYTNEASWKLLGRPKADTVKRDE